jgi:hypothetical protein
MIVTLSFLITFGPPLALCMLPVRDSGDDADRRKRPVPAPVLPNAPEPVETTARQLPDCLIPRPELGAAETTERELEPV